MWQANEDLTAPRAFHIHLSQTQAHITFYFAIIFGAYTRTRHAGWWYRGGTCRWYSLLVLSRSDQNHYLAYPRWACIAMHSMVRVIRVQNIEFSYFSSQNIFALFSIESRWPVEDDFFIRFFFFNFIPKNSHTLTKIVRIPMDGKKCERKTLNKHVEGSIKCVAWATCEATRNENARVHGIYYVVEAEKKNVRTITRHHMDGR